MVFSKVHPACHSIVNGIKPGSNSKQVRVRAFERYIPLTRYVPEGYFNESGFAVDGKCLLRLFGAFTNRQDKNTQIKRITVARWE